MKFGLALLGVMVLVAGCTSKSEDIQTSYVSPMMHESYTCEQLTVEGERVSARAASVAGVQDENRKDDKVKTAVGVVLFWPVLLFNEGDGQTAAELASLKGQMKAIEQTSVKKNCNIQFRRS
jgi:hypothetical protein